VCIVGYQGVSYALIGEVAGKAKTGAALGLMITINAGAATLGTPIFGHIVDRTGSYATGWRVLAAAISLGIVSMAVLLKEPRRERRGA
jgi:MFS family permease